MIRTLAWCGTIQSTSSIADAADVEHPLRRVHHHRRREPEHRAAVHLDHGSAAQRAHDQVVAARAVGAELAGRRPSRGSAPADITHGAGAVAEQDAGRAVVPVEDLRERLGAHHEHVLRQAGLDLRDGVHERVDPAGAGGRDVVGRRGVRAEPVGDDRGAWTGSTRRASRSPRSRCRCRPARGRSGRAPAAPRRGRGRTPQTSGAATRRSAMPVRVADPLVATCRSRRAISSLVTIRSGTAAPIETMPAVDRSAPITHGASVEQPERERRLDGRLAADGDGGAAAAEPHAQALHDDRHVEHVARPHDAREPRLVDGREDAELALVVGVRERADRRYLGATPRP